MSRKFKPEKDCEVRLVEQDELTYEDIDAVAEFIACIAYKNLKKAQESADRLIEEMLKNDKKSTY